MSVQLTLEDRQRRLRVAAGKYVRGQIDAKTFEDAESSYGPDYHVAVRKLAQRRTNPFRSLRRFFQKSPS